LIEGNKNMVARLAADTFIIVLRTIDVGSDEPEQIAEKIKASFNLPFNYRGQELFVTGSIGITSSTSGDNRFNRLLQKVDLALYEAKTQGRYGVCRYSGDLVANVSRHFSIQSDLRRAMQNNEFEVFYQSKICALDNSVSGFESLIRWVHPIRGMIPPDQFIPIAEEAGQIVQIGEWVLKTACQKNQQWIDQGWPMSEWR
jgi:predicted signal transduction protein with EAL and GGDEF domain